MIILSSPAFFRKQNFKLKNPHAERRNMLPRCLCLTVVSMLGIAHASQIDGGVITHDVIIIGGGASGVYAAVRLQDLNQSVILVEQKSRLGGHTETYTDPVTEQKIDIGVEIFQNWTIVKEFFDRFNVPLAENIFPNNLVARYVDFDAGQTLPGNYSPPDPSDALTAYAAQLSKYPYLPFGFDLPDPVPSDLLLPFGEYVTKYGFEDMVNVIFDYGQGLGDLLQQTTIYVMKIFGLDDIRNLGGGFLTTARHDNSEVYEKALEYLTGNVLLESHAISTRRNCTGYVEVIIETPNGIKKVHAKKILLTIPPKLANLAGFDLDARERSVLGQFQNSAYYTGVLKNTGIPRGLFIENAGQDTLYNLPKLPGVYSISESTIPGLFNFKYGSPTALSDTQVKDDIIASIRRLQEIGIATVSLPEFATFASHTPFELTVPSRSIDQGFYRHLYSLQGYRNTYYSGAAFHVQDTSMLWRFTEDLLVTVLQQ